jgi:hypothetical protein
LEINKKPIEKSAMIEQSNPVVAGPDSELAIIDQNQ